MMQVIFATFFVILRSSLRIPIILSLIDMRIIRQSIQSCAIASLVVLCLGNMSKADNLGDLKQVELGVQKVTKSCTPATVALVSFRGDTGTGVIVSEDGLILTAAHVIQGDEITQVVFEDGRIEKARVLGANFTRDAAMVKLEGKGPYPYVKLGDSDNLQVGSFVVALGHAKGFDPDRRAPIRLGRLATDGKQRFLVSECTLIGGDSGGPLFDLTGNLIGIHSSIGPHLKINNHVPLSVFKQDWNKLAQGHQWGQLGLHPMADPDTPVLGFTMLEILQGKGVIVDDVIPNSPADKAGILKGDVVVSMDSRELITPKDMIRELGRYKPGETVKLVIMRDGQMYQAPLTFGRRGDLMGQ